MFEKIEADIAKGLPLGQIINELGLEQSSRVPKHVCIYGWGKRDFEIYINADPGIEKTLSRQQIKQIKLDLGKKAYDFYIKNTNNELLFTNRYKDIIAAIEARYLNHEVIKKMQMITQFGVNYTVITKIINYVENRLKKSGFELEPYIAIPEPKIKKPKKEKIKKEKPIKPKKEKIIKEKEIVIKIKKPKQEKTKPKIKPEEVSFRESLDKFIAKASLDYNPLDNLDAKQKAMFAEIEARRQK